MLRTKGCQAGASRFSRAKTFANSAEGGTLPRSCVTKSEYSFQASETATVCCGKPETVANTLQATQTSQSRAVRRSDSLEYGCLLTPLGWRFEGAHRISCLRVCHALPRDATRHSKLGVHSIQPACPAGARPDKAGGRPSTPQAPSKLAVRSGSQSCDTAGYICQFRRRCRRRPSDFSASSRKCELWGGSSLSARRVRPVAPAHQRAGSSHRTWLLHDVCARWSP